MTGIRRSTVWLFMVTAVAIHVTDEAITGFLEFYNPAVLRLRARLGFFPVPTFTFRTWLAGLIIAILAGFALTPRVAAGGAGTRWICGILAFLMVGNACGHLLGSLFLGRILPGFWSSPLLLAASAWMLARVARESWRRADQVSASAAGRPIER